MSEYGRVAGKSQWREALLRVLRAWNRNQVWKVLTSIVVIWIGTGTALYFAERAHESSICDVARVPLERLGHPLQRTQ